MHTTEPKKAFLAMRANGWSLRSISQQLGVPKSTLFNWESDPTTRHTINVIKSLQLEKLQEKYLPSFEEELQRLSTCLCCIERALDKQDFDSMRPEFLLRTSLQLRSRLNKLSSDVQPVRTLDRGELPPNPLPGCISRSPTAALDADGQPEFGGSSDHGLASPTFGSPAAGSFGGPVPNSQESSPSASDPSNLSPFNPSTSSEVLHPFWDKNENSSKPEPSTPATCTNENGTVVPYPEPCDSSPSPPPPAERDGERRPSVPDSSSSSSNTDPCTPSHGRERYGELATPLTNIPVHVDADQIALTAGFGSPRTSESVRPCVPARSIPSPPPRKPCATRAQSSRDSVKRP